MPNDLENVNLWLFQKIRILEGDVNRRYVMAYFLSIHHKPVKTFFIHLDSFHYHIKLIICNSLNKVRQIQTIFFTFRQVGNFHTYSTSPSALCIASSITMPSAACESGIGTAIRVPLPSCNPREDSTIQSRSILHHFPPICL